MAAVIAETAALMSSRRKAGADNEATMVAADAVAGGASAAAASDRGAGEKSSLTTSADGLPRPLYSDDRSRRIVGVAGLPVPGSQVRVAELVQSGCYLGLQSRLGRCSIAGDQPGEPALSRIALGLRRIR